MVCAEMRFDDPAWRATPVQTSWRVVTSLVRKRIRWFRQPSVPYGPDSRIYADLATPLGLQLYRYHPRDLDVELTRRLLSPGDTFVDGGANIGLFSIAAARRVGPSGKVIAFEPGRAVRFRLLKNLALNDLAQIEVMPFALWSSGGEAPFRIFDDAGAGLNHLAPGPEESGAVEFVTLTTLDNALSSSDRNRLTLIKLDLEGAEHAALQGSADTLREAKPDLIVEIEPLHLKRMGSSDQEVASLLRTHRYELFKPTASADGGIALRPLRDISARGAGAPNIFATTKPDRVVGRGIKIL
jgi:FkbM family methyltransferase